MIDFRSFVVGVVSSPHPHAPMHMKTLDVLPEVEAVHLCGIEGEDLEAMASQSSKVRSQTTDLDELLGRLFEEIGAGEFDRLIDDDGRRHSLRE